MADNKKSFVAYVDWKNTFDMLNDTEAGQLVKHLLSYVNDENPELNDRYLKLAFEPIKLQLKRDLQKYETVKEKRSEAGKKSAEIKKQNASNSTHVESVEQNQQASTNSTVNDNDTVNVNDTVNDTVTDILLKKETKDIPVIFNFKKSLLETGADEKLIDDWLKVRTKKKATNSETAFNLFNNELKKSNTPVNDILILCIKKDWKGFQASWLTTEQYGKPPPNSNTTSNTGQGYRPASVNTGELVQELTNDLANGDIPGKY